MANRYANIPGASKINQSYNLITEGFDKVEQEMDAKPDASIAQVNDIAFDADDTLTVEGGTGITVTTIPGEKKMRIVATGEATPGAHAIEHITGGSDVIPNATTTSSGLMSASDKTRLDGAMLKTADSDLNMNGRSITNIARHNIQTSGNVLTISNGAITVSRSFYIVDTEGGEPTDELDTIHGGSPGDVLFLRQNVPSRKITIRHQGGGTGNIRTFDATDVEMMYSTSLVQLLCVGSLWYVVGVQGVKRSGDTMTGTLTIQGGQLLQKHSRPQHALISTATNEGVRTEYREDQKRLRWQSTDGNGGFVGQLAYLDCQTGEIYLTPSEYKAYHAGNSGPFYRGSGSPEGVVTAPPGSIYQNTSGGTNTTLYVKRSGTGNTGWFAVA